MQVVIPRNTSIPTTMLVENFTTIKVNQTKFAFNIYQGERAMVKDNYLLDPFYFTISPEPKGVPKFKNIFSIDENGILKVSVEETRTRNENEITITNSSGKLSKEDIEVMVREAKKFKADDERHKKRAETKNALEDYIYKIRTDLNNGKIGSGLSTAEKKKIEGAIERESDLVNDQQLAEVDDYEQRWWRSLGGHR